MDRVSEDIGLIVAPLADEAAAYPGNSFNPPRPVGRSVMRGMRCCCPACGVGSLFPRFLKLAAVCQHCGEELHHARPDDAPPYFVMLIVGHIVVPLALVLEEAFAPPMWTTATALAIAASVLALALLAPTKGAIVGLQWALWMHGFDPREHADDVGERM